jgi:hypothetical protein
MNEDTKEQNSSLPDRVLLDDCVSNYKTILGFATDKVLIAEFETYMDESEQEAKEYANGMGFAFGLS